MDDSTVDIYGNDYGYSQPDNNQSLPTNSQHAQHQAMLHQQQLAYNSQGQQQQQQQQAQMFNQQLMMQQHQQLPQPNQYIYDHMHQDAAMHPQSAQDEAAPPELVPRDHPGWSGATALVISNLQWWTADIDILDICAEAGVGNPENLQEIYFAQTRNNGKSSGTCYLLFSNADAASRAKQFLQSVEVHDRRLVVQYSQPANPYKEVPSEPTRPAPPRPADGPGAKPIRPNVGDTEGWEEEYTEPSVASAAPMTQPIPPGMPLYTIPQTQPSAYGNNRPSPRMPSMRPPPSLPGLGRPPPPSMAPPPGLYKNSSTPPPGMPQAQAPPGMPQMDRLHEWPPPGFDDAPPGTTQSVGPPGVSVSNQQPPSINQTSSTEIDSKPAGPIWTEDWQPRFEGDTVGYKPAARHRRGLIYHNRGGPDTSPPGHHRPTSSSNQTVIIERSSDKHDRSSKSRRDRSRSYSGDEDSSSKGDYRERDRRGSRQLSRRRYSRSPSRDRDDRDRRSEHRERHKDHKDRDKHERRRDRSRDKESSSRHRSRSRDRSDKDRDRDSDRKSSRHKHKSSRHRSRDREERDREKEKDRDNNNNNNSNSNNDDAAVKVEDVSV
ncbi:hypothetical protein SeMB42_g07225 [Synchytrium endobioticum]|uniref:RRM domain-containing protein n=1 Tax=Synchytrium endobioticum TaxID=286115 RepID=A0A507CC74_9FUNG|nr:hypothetical protein SeMB42_g07225 [Synchytrium endobioticum]TPX44277.1 hypothetical protein SeLEV6574_g04586 [Synchytrium endobioticum]